MPRPRPVIDSTVRRLREIAFVARRGIPAPPEPPVPTPEVVEPAREPGWWDLLPFTTHRLEVAPGTWTTGPHGVEPYRDIRAELVVEEIGGTLDSRTVVDLGCLEGAFTLEFARRGAARSLGIEAREVSVERCRLAQRFLGLDAAEFVCADIKEELPRHDPFDVVFAAGILYHVADPLALLTVMRSACTGVAIVCTHVADADVATHGCSPVVERELGGRTYHGRLFPEYDPSASAAERDGYLWAAYSDVDSFWPLEDDLVAMIGHAGFASAEKVVVTDPDPRRWGVDRRQRVLYVARV